ncbi:MAG: transglycosylase SLT domain-containing protein [Chloroflexi bacterium]|nr:transglycosylase SLT domain-containing protein [Chloroflexota bacterium]
MAEAPPLAAAPEAPPRITAREELNAILGPQPDFMIPTPAGPPADIGEAALRIGVDPGEADWYAWDKVRQGIMDDIARHSLRTNANDINGLVDRAARMQTEEGWLFGRWGEMRKGVTGAKGRAKIKAAMLPDDMTWAQYYKQNKEAAEAYMDLADELEDILAGGPPPTAGPLAVRTPIEVEGLPIWQRRPEVGEVDVTSILPERLPTAPERVTPLLPPPTEAGKVTTLFELPPEEPYRLTMPGHRKPLPATARIQVEDLQKEIAGIREQITQEPWKRLGGTRRGTLEDMITKREAKIAELMEIIGPEAAPPAGVIPGELPAMPPLEAAAAGVTKMEAPAAAARGDVLLGRGTEQLRKAQVEEMGRGAQIGMFGEIEEVTTPAMMRNQMVRLRDEIDILTKQATSPKIAGRMKAFLQKHIDTKTAEIEDIARRLVTEETGAFRPADIVAPISDELGKWKAHVTGNLGRADEVIDQSPEAMRAIRRARDEAIKMTKASIGEAQIYGLKETNRVLGDYLRKGNLVDLASNFIPFAHWPAYNLPYWGWTFMERPHIPAAMAKARTAQAMQNRDMPDRLRHTVPIPGSERWMESLGFPAGNALRFDPWRALSFMQSMPGGTPYQSQQLREVMDDPTSPQSVMTIGSQMGVRPWPWFEYVLGYKGLMGDDWYPYDLSSFEPLARALFDTDATPSSWLREKLGMEPNRFLDYQMEKEVRGQIMRGETEDWEKARTTARQKTALYAVVGMTTGFYPKEFTAEEDERLGMTEALRQAVAQDVRDTGGDPDLMGIGEQWDWAKRHGSTMTDVSSNINKFYEANPEYRDIQQTWMSEEERNVDEQTSAYYDESSAVAEKRDAALAALPIPHPDEDESAAWDEWATEDAAVREKYPLANLTPSSARPIEVLQDRTSAALLRQLKDTRPWYDQEKYDSYYEYTQALKDWEANIRNNARGLWGPEVFMRHQSLASLEAIDEYTKARHSITGAADYVYKKHIESPYWEAGKKAQVTQLEGLADWENVREPIAQWQEYVDMAAEVSGIDPRIIGAIIEVESGGDADAYNKRSQATGLMQVMPGEVFEGRPLSDELKDPKANIDTGTAILQGYLDDTSWDLKQALYQYSEGAAWSSFESYEKNYWDRLSTKFKGLWGVSLGGLRADASDKIMARAEDVDADVIVSLIQMEYPGRWTDAELRAELEGKEIRGVQEAYAIEQPASAAERSAGDDVWDMRASLPPGVYRSALDDLAEVSSFLSTGENPGAALEAIEVYVDEHPITGNAQEWAQAEREHDQFRRYVYNTWGAAIYEEQNAYYEAKAAGRYPEPSERLEAYWDAHTQFRQEHPLYTRFYFPDWQPYEGKKAAAPRAARQPYEGKKAAAPRAARQPTKQEVLQETSTAWKDFADTFEDKALLELIQSYLVMSASQRGWFLSRNPELRAWLQAQDPKRLGELKASLESSLPRPRTSYATQRAPSLRWYRSSW